MRKYVITVLFAALLAAAAAVMMMPADSESIAAENRDIKEMPELTLETAASGEFASDFDEYVNDNMGFRGKLMEISRNIQSHFGYTPKLVGTVISTTSDIGIGETLEGSLVIIQGRIMEMFSKKPEVETKYADVMNSIRRAVPENVKMYSMLVPTQLEFAEAMFANAQDSQKSCIDNIDGMLSDGITAVDLYSKLDEAAEAGEDLYFKTDHHWNMDGAYYGYKSFMEATEGEAAQKSDFARKERGNFFGTLYQKASARVNISEQDSLFYYDTTENKDISIVMKDVKDGKTVEYGKNAKLFDDTKDDYLFFLGGDNPLVEITNNSAANEKTLVVIKDSYANAMVPWLINNYKRVILIDPRSYKGSLTDEIAAYNADELLVINYVFTTTFGDYCVMLNDLIG